MKYAVLPCLFRLSYRLLLEAPDVLLLDEPTNHLDTTSIGWLENYLQNYRCVPRAAFGSLSPYPHRVLHSQRSSVGHYA